VIDKARENPNQTGEVEEILKFTAGIFYFGPITSIKTSGRQ